MKWAFLPLLTATLWAGDSARLVYMKSFPGSAPAYTQIVVDLAGNGEYREAEDDDQPLKFKLSEADVKQVLELVEKLDHFKRPLESGLKVAFMGMKTFRWVDGDQKTDVKFNYSEDLSAQALLDWFERMAESEQRRIDLERTAKYDRLGVFKALALLGVSMDRKRLVAVDQYLPMLDRIANNESYMHTARVRASEIAEAIRNPAPKP
jgi:hypothetical protein